MALEYHHTPLVIMLGRRCRYCKSSLGFSSQQGSSFGDRYCTAFLLFIYHYLQRSTCLDRWEPSFHSHLRPASRVQGSCRPCAPIRSAHSHPLQRQTYSIVPKVDLFTGLLNILDLLGRKLKVPKVLVTFNPLFILGRSDGYNTRLHSPSQ
jgi:hypothetical protein